MKSLLILFFCLPLFAQDEIKLMSYNILNYPGNDTIVRNPYFRTVVGSVNPDILVVQEIQSQDGVNGFLSNVMNTFGESYSAGIFIDGPDTDNGIFYKQNKFNFVSNTPISTALRDINEFKIVYIPTSDTLRIYSVHLKASSGSSNEQQRLQEVTILRNFTDNLTVGSDFIVVGDFNIYSSNEPAYQKLLDQSTSGYFIDQFNLSGTWNNSAYAQYHTQSPRTRQFGGGSTGGMDDRFDMILFSLEVWNMGGISYIPGTVIPYGNDGLHYNDSINRPPNNAVSQQIANALHYVSDHLPVLATFDFDYIVPVELTSFTASVENKIRLTWTTASEKNNYGFEIERDNRVVGFVIGKGTTTEMSSYSFTEELNNGSYNYRLKQIDLDGTFTYSKTISVNVNSTYTLELHSFPNPFNSSATITYVIPTDGQVVIKLFDILGSEIKTLLNKYSEAGEYRISFDANELMSGIYFIQLQTENNYLNKKIIILK